MPRSTTLSDDPGAEAGRNGSSGTSARPGERVLVFGEEFIRYGLAVIFLWFGGMKFTDYEAAAISPFIMNSPLVGWWHTSLGIKGASLMLGVVEVATGLLLLARPFSSQLAAIGAGMGAAAFLVTQSFLFSTPGVWEERGGGFPAISMTGGFLIKDLTLLGGCLFLLARCLADPGARDGAERIAHDTPAWLDGLARLGAGVMRYGLAAIFLIIGLAKFYDYEAAGIAPLIMNSPVVGWWQTLLGVKGTSLMLGVVEIATGLLLAARPFSARLSALGAALAVVALAITLTFFFTTPGVAEPRAGGFPAISADLGQFLLKDLGLLAIAAWLLGESLVAARSRPDRWPT